MRQGREGSLVRQSMRNQAAGADCIKRPASCAARLASPSVLRQCIPCASHGRRMRRQARCQRIQQLYKSNYCCFSRGAMRQGRAQMRDRKDDRTAGNKSCLRPGDQQRPQFSATARTGPRRYFSTLLLLSFALDARPVRRVLTILLPAQRNCQMHTSYLNLTF